MGDVISGLRANIIAQRRTEGSGGWGGGYYYRGRKYVVGLAGSAGAPSCAFSDMLTGLTGWRAALCVCVCVCADYANRGQRQRKPAARSLTINSTSAAAAVLWPPGVTSRARDTRREKPSSERTHSLAYTNKCTKALQNS